MDIKKDMQVRLGKDFNWEMSHRLPFHNGGCQNVHGHSYKMRVDIIGTTDANGMVIDFYEIDRIVRPYLEAMDHAFVVDKDDTDVIEFLDKHGFKKFVIDITSTAEHLAMFFIQKFAPEFKQFTNISHIKVRVFETSDAFAEVQMDI